MGIRQRRTEWSVYECPAVAGWEGVVSAEEHLMVLAGRGADTETVDSFVLLLEAAVEGVADLTSWDGKGTWLVTALPDVGHREMRMMLVVTSGERTYIASTTELPWLAEHERRAGESFRPRPRSGPVSAQLRRFRELRRQALADRPGVT